MLLRIDVFGEAAINDFAFCHHHEALADAAHQVKVLLDHQYSRARSTDLVEYSRQVIHQDR